ncbi:unnamed protein product, partial [Laminaria digitata]
FVGVLVISLPSFAKLINYNQPHHFKRPPVLTSPFLLLIVCCALTYSWSQVFMYHRVLNVKCIIVTSRPKQFLALAASPTAERVTSWNILRVQYSYRRAFGDPVITTVQQYCCINSTLYISMSLVLQSTPATGFSVQ